MKLSVIIPTLKRPNAVCKLLDSIVNQTLQPDEIIVVDASDDHYTEISIQKKKYKLPIKYYRVDKPNKGSAQQRNFGINLVAPDIDIIGFLDDDLVLEKDYFENIVNTYLRRPDAVGVGGVDLKDNPYHKIEEGQKFDNFNYYQFDGWVRKEPLRSKARKVFGLMPDMQPDLIPDFSHGRSGFPPTGKIYQVEHFMGGIATYRKSLFTHVSFSSHFEGYGLYEDFDFCVSALPYGKLYVNTNAQVWHYHEAGGRPSKYRYGKMVVRNGWYVWKRRFPTNTLKARFKWHATDFLLAQIRLFNVITGPDRWGAFTEYCGRTVGWFSLWINKPEVK